MREDRPSVTINSDRRTIGPPPFSPRTRQTTRLIGSHSPSVIQSPRTHDHRKRHKYGGRVYSKTRVVRKTGKGSPSLRTRQRRDSTLVKGVEKERKRKKGEGRGGEG